MLMKLFRDEQGVIISAELALVLTIVVIGVVVGLSEVAAAVNTELNDISNAIGALDQSYAISSFKGVSGGLLGKTKSITAGTRWNDSADDCDANTSCDMICGIPVGATTETGP